MGNANKNSVKKPAQPLVKSKVVRDSIEQELSDKNFELTNNRLAKKSKKIFEQESSDYISQCSGKSMGLMEVFRLKNLLNYKDLRSVIQWCVKNDVFIIHQGNKQFVNQWEFILSFYKPFINHLKRKHKNWKEMFLNYLSGELGQLLTIPIDNVQIINSGNYKPKTTKEVSFLDKIKKI